MAIKYKKKKQKQNNVLITIITAILIFCTFIVMIGYLYDCAEEDAYEALHLQTKQIKDDISLQIKSDRENLATMANFAAKLHRDGEGYDIMFDSFKAIGLIENIGILNPDNTFTTKAGTIDLNGRISFEEEKEKGAYISGRVKDLTRVDYEIIRSAVPIKSGHDIIGILYGVIKLDKIGERYNAMAKDLDAQLFVYEKETGKLVVDTVHEKLGNISFLKERKYKDGYSYEQMASTDKGFVAFRSVYKNEDAHLHYSTIDDLGWMIALVRYDSQVFARANSTAQFLFLMFALTCITIVIYILILMLGERRINKITSCAAEIRRELLETIEGQNNIFDALVLVCDFAKSRSTVFFDTNGDDYKYIRPEAESLALLKNERHYLKTMLFRYAFEVRKISDTTLNVVCIKPNAHLKRTNPAFYDFLREHKIFEISFATIASETNHVTILGAVNPKRGKAVRVLAERVIACFSMALQNKNHINKTEIAATTDSLTGVLNRASYKKDVSKFDDEKPSDFSCVYIDVNELHICNNKYGHAAGDEMLLYIANGLKDIFKGHKIYRIGGDEFLVFAKDTKQVVIKKNIELFTESLKPRNYHVAIGMSFRTHNVNTEEVVREAEVRMYEEKAAYYQNKEKQNVAITRDKDYVHIETGILEIDTMISILNESYNGIYRVSLNTDKARRILMPAYLKYNENEENFSSLFSRYVSEMVDPDYHRAVLSFLNYDAIKRQLADGTVPRIRYKKSDGETVVLSVYKLCGEKEPVSDTLWVFAKE